MGMYTQLVFGASINPEKYPEIEDTLNYILTGGNEPLELPNHEFFKTDRWRRLFTGDSHYFDFKTFSKITTYDYCDTVHITIVSNIKNYNMEIQKFLNWIDSYLDNSEGEFLGFFRYEENREPTLIYKGSRFRYLPEE
mgnify:CR=1 FL=1